MAVLLVCVLLLGRAVEAADSTTPPPSYLTLISLARQGDPRSGVTEMFDWPPARIESESIALRTDAGCATCRRAAILLHTEAAFVAMHTRREDSVKAHWRAASRIAEWIEQDATPEQRGPASDFERRWRLAVGYLYQELIGPQPALAAYYKVLKRHPQDPETLVAVGSLFEHLMAAPNMAAESGIGVQQPGPYYERALAAQPDHVEARLRLGAVSARHGRPDVARQALARVLAGEAQPFVRALAHLFLAEAEASERNLVEAIEHYRAALAAEPRLQPAQLGLSRVLQRAGRGREAVDSLLGGLRATKEGNVWSWLSYHTSALHSYRASMDRLWQEVRE